MSCAWQIHERKLIEFCENGAKAVAFEATKARYTRIFPKMEHCRTLTNQTTGWQAAADHAPNGAPAAQHYEPISWDEAFALTAAELNKLDSKRSAFYTSGRASNEAAFLYQLFVRQFGTNNLPDCSNMCHESSGSALTETIGVGKER